MTITEATFTAGRLEDALALVKRALGAEAMIVSSRRLDGDDGRFEVRAALPPRPEETPKHDSKRQDAPRPTERSAIERVLERNDVPPALARELAQRAEGSPRSPRELRDALERVIRGVVGFVGPARLGRVLALAGPTGVGKTTTIAKLAARDALVERLDVALISVDDYRVGGADQLAAYAELIGVPFEAASSGPQLARAVARHATADRIYVDTPGRGPRDRGAIEDLARTLGDAGTNVEVHLCIAAATGRGELQQVIERHACLRPRAITITKLDEAVALGSALVAPIRAALPLAHFTTGQRVPEDIELASAARLAAALTGEDVS